MASQGDPQRPADGIDLTTLVLSAIASAAAAYITSKIWGPGTLFSAAFAPVIVALVKEGLRRPTEKVANVVPAVVTPTRWTRGGADDPGLVAEPDPDAPPAPDVHPDPDAPHVVLPPVVATSETGPVRVCSTRSRRLRWRLALITGLLGFGVCVVVFTVPELIAGKSIGGSHKTTIFGGPRHHTKKSNTTTSTSTTKTSTTETTPTTKTTTVTRTQTVTTPTTTTQTPTATTQTPTTATPAPSTSAPPTAGAEQAPATPDGATP
jgi:hypothetical protein